MRIDPLKVGVTSGRRPSPAEEAAAREVAEREGFVFRPRRGRSRAALLAGDPARGEAPLDVLIVVTPERVEAYMAGEEAGGDRPGGRRGGCGPLFFHPNMAKLRIQRLRHGGGDPMVAAMGLEPGMHVLDCTAGLGADAVVASFVCGEEGKVVGWESSPVVACVIREGMARYRQPARSELPELVAAIRRVRVERRDHREGLKELPDGAFDIVYFDPMFRRPLLESEALLPLRLFADPRPLTPEVLAEAKRVARRRVVVKDRAEGEELDRLGLPVRHGGGNSRIVYGIWSRSGG